MGKQTYLTQKEFRKGFWHAIW